MAFFEMLTTGVITLWVSPRAIPMDGLYHFWFREVCNRRLSGQELRLRLLRWVVCVTYRHSAYEPEYDTSH